MHTQATVGHPEGLLSELFLESLCGTFRAALDLSRGRDVQVQLAG